jgi:hypothetical protein
MEAEVRSVIARDFDKFNDDNLNCSVERIGGSITLRWL